MNPTKGPIARGVVWFNDYVIDTVVNAAGFAARAVARGVYAFDQQGIDGAINASGAGTGAFAGVLRVLQTGKVQQYAAMLFVGTLLIVLAFIIF